jgi:hypothetical protein
MPHDFPLLELDDRRRDSASHRCPRVPVQPTVTIFFTAARLRGRAAVARAEDRLDDQNSAARAGRYQPRHHDGVGACRDLAYRASCERDGR